MPRFIYPSLLLLAASFLLSCSGDNAKNTGKNDNVEITELSAVDSVFTDLKEAQPRDIIPLANRLFHLLDTNATTDSLIQFSSAANPKEVVANADYWMAEYLYQANRRQEAMTLAQQAMREAKAFDDAQLQASLNSLLSAVYSSLGMFEEGLKCLQRCYDESRHTGNRKNMSSDLNNMAALCLQLKQFEKAKGHIDRAIELERQLVDEDKEEGTGALAIRLGIASETYMLLGRLEEAERFASEAYALDKDASRNGKAAIRQSQLASVLIKRKQLDEARKVLTEACDTLKNVGNTYSYIICLNQLGDVALERNSMAEAEKNFLEAVDRATENGYRYLKQRALQGAWKALRGSDIHRASEFLEQYALLSDSLNTEASEKQLANMQAQVEYTELQAENERLAFRSRLWTLVGAVALLACLLAIVVLCYFLYAKSRKKIIERQNDVIIDIITEKDAEIETLEEAEKETVAETEETPQKAVKESTAQDSELINTLVEYVNSRLASYEPVDVAACAAHLCISQRHLTRKIAAITGLTTVAFINHIKINRAKRLLVAEPDLSITDISFKCGFETIAYFCKTFKDIVGQSPKNFRDNK